MDLRRLYMTKDQIAARTASGTVKVYGKPVALPSAFERAGVDSTLDGVMARNTEEHDAGCHGDCGGQCAEATYARWSAVGWA